MHCVQTSQSMGSIRSRWVSIEYLKVTFVEHSEYELITLLSIWVFDREPSVGTPPTEKLSVTLTFELVTSKMS